MPNNELSNEQIKALLKSIGLKDSDLVNVSEEDMELLRKSLPEDFTAEQFGELTEDETVVTALNEGDAETFGKHVAEFLRKSASDDDDDEEEEEEEEDEDEDEEDDGKIGKKVKQAARALDIFDEDDEEAEETRKSLSDYMIDEGVDDILDIEDVVEPLVKSILGFVDQEDNATRKELKAVRKSQRKIAKGLAELTELLEGAGMRPRGRALPYQVQGAPQDGSIDGASVGDVSKSILEAQVAGVVDETEALRLMAAAQQGGEDWQAVAPRFEEIKKAVEQHNNST